MDIALHVKPDGPTTAGAILRTNQSYLELLGSKTTLDGGIAFCCDKFPTLPGGNQFREVWIESPEAAAVTFNQTEALYHDQGLSCDRWALAEGRSSEPVDEVLRSGGFARDDSSALVLRAWADPRPAGAVRVLPARPMRQAFIEIQTEVARPAPGRHQATLVDAAVERLDDHRMDAFVALLDRQPVGVGALFQVGDVGRLLDFQVLPEYRRRGVGRAILTHAVNLARRLSLRLVCAEVPIRDENARAFCEVHGFTEDGRLIGYQRNTGG